ncbi:MAG: hypothetical protein IPK82_37520 [Polyangiaceae bacterium]|nr:hypothetical protein [Polyangiaceae bacterium]
MTDLVERIERNRFAGREFILWLWFESETFETNLRPSGGSPIALWIETRMTLTLEKDESVLKSAAPAASPEAKEALRQGKLPKEAKFRLSNGEHEFAFLFKGDTLGMSSVSVPAELKDKGDEVYEVFYERARLLEELEAIIEALYNDFLTLRLSDGWNKEIVPFLKRFANEKRADDGAYLQVKKRLLSKKSKR